MAIVKLFSAARTASVILGNAMYRFVFYDIVSPRKFCSFFLEAAICARSHLLGCFKLASLTSLIIHTIWISPRNHVFGTALGTRKSVQGGYRWIYVALFQPICETARSPYATMSIRERENLNQRWPHVYGSASEDTPVSHPDHAGPQTCHRILSVITSQRTALDLFT